MCATAPRCGSSGRSNIIGILPLVMVSNLKSWLSTWDLVHLHHSSAGGEMKKRGKVLENKKAVYVLGSIGWSVGWLVGWSLARSLARFVMLVVQTSD